MARWKTQPRLPGAGTHVFGTENGFLRPVQVPDFQGVLFPTCPHTLRLGQVLAHPAHATPHLGFRLNGAAERREL